MTSREPLERFGDILPLPLPCVDDAGHGESSCSKQQLQSRRRAAEGAKGTVAAINVLGGHHDEARWPRAPKNLAQHSALRRILRVNAEERELLEKRSDLASLKKFLKTTGVGYDTTPGRLARFDSGVLPLPTDQTEALDPAPWVAETLRHLLDDPVGEMMLDETERGRLLDLTEQPGMCVDPSLSDVCVYARFLVTLYRAKLIRFAVVAKSICGVFCVAKKTPGRLRLVIDCRQSSRLLKPPPWTPFGLLECPSRIWLESMKEGFIAQEDVRDYFYRIRLDPGLDQFFGLPKIPVAELRKCFDTGEEPAALRELDGSCCVNAAFSVMPMGFSWAFFSSRRKSIASSPLPSWRISRPRISSWRGSRPPRFRPNRTGR